MLNFDGLKCSEGARKNPANTMNETEKQQLAQEAARRIAPQTPFYSQEEHDNEVERIMPFIHVAIEKAHQEGWYEGRNFEIKLRSEPAAIATSHEPAADK